MDPSDVWLVDEFNQATTYLAFEDGNFRLQQNGVTAGSYLLVETSRGPGMKCSEPMQALLVL